MAFFYDNDDGIDLRNERRLLRYKSADILDVNDKNFERNFRLNKAAFLYVLREFEACTNQSQRQGALSAKDKLGACLRFFAEGNYQHGVGKDYNVNVAQPTISKILNEVLEALEERLCNSDMNEFSSAVALQQKRNTIKSQLTDAIKESCLPKMLCEMASKPDYMLTEKEKDLLQLIRSSTMSLAMNGAPSKWHFAAHMGELLRFTGDDNTGPMGCANLWPNCPISSKKLMKLSYKVKI